MPPVPGTNIANVVVKLYDAEIKMADPAVLPPAGGQTVLLLVQLLNGLHVTVPALDVSETSSDEAGMPTAKPEIVVAIWPTVMAHPLLAQPAPRVDTCRAATFTASARVW